MKYFIVIAIAVLLALTVSWAGAQGGKLVGIYPVFLVCTALAFLVNWLAYVPAVINKTEKFYDLIGSLTYLSVMGLAVYLSGPMDVRGWIVAAMVSVWALRLGSFLFLRIHRSGGDQRFDDIKINPARFFMAWTLQALWVVLTSACAVAIITTNSPEPLGVLSFVGMGLWLFGFSVEVIADRQKTIFKNDKVNDGKFITSGLWAWSRHPNYFGEIVLWTGIALFAVPILSGWQYLCLISPVFVYLLLTRLSGIPTLVRTGEKRWGHDPSYRDYLDRTPILLPFPPKPQR